MRLVKKVRIQLRKISMTCLLSDPSEFTGGDLLFSEMGDQTNPCP